VPSGRNKVRNWLAGLPSSYIENAAGCGYKAEQGLTSPHEQVDDKNDQQHAADPASDHGTAIVETSASTKQKQQDENDQNDVHMRLSLFVVRATKLLGPVLNLIGPMAFRSQRVLGAGFGFVISHGRHAITSHG
jgi:hypothetical protein